MVWGEQQVVGLVEKVPRLETLVNRQLEGGEVEHRGYVQVARAHLVDELVGTGLDQAQMDAGVLAPEGGGLNDQGRAALACTCQPKAPGLSAAIASSSASAVVSRSSTTRA